MDKNAELNPKSLAVCRWEDVPQLESPVDVHCLVGELELVREETELEGGAAGCMRNIRTLIVNFKNNP